MAKLAAKKSALSGVKRAAGSPPKGGARRVKAARHAANAGSLAFGKERFDSVMLAAQQSGLLGGKSGRIAGRVSPALVRQAKRQTGIVSDTELIAFALAAVALEDNFAQVFKESRGKVDPGVDLGFGGG